MKFRKILYAFSLFVSCSGIAQTFSGIILDAKTKTPVESASVYFDNTTIGTTTNSQGKFSISYTDATQSGLVISYLGYETQTITDYRQKDNVTIYLFSANNVLGEVIVNADDGLTRKQKLRLFRKEFLGQSRYGRSCEILNEDALILKYNKKEKQLTATSIEPLIIENKRLQYLVSFDIQIFELNFNYVEEKNNVFSVKSVSYAGNTFYKNLDNFNEKLAEKNRRKTYNGSVLQFMRALYNEDLEAKKYQIFYRGFKTNPWKHFEIQTTTDSSIKQILLDKPVSILHDKKNQSKIIFLNSSILIDKYGNYGDVTKVLFSGVMGNQRVGDLLPVNYGLN